MRDALALTLGPFMERQRWYGAKGQRAGVTLATLEEVAPGLLRAVAEAGADRYQVLLGVGELGPGPEAVVAETEVDGRRAVVFDALADERLALEVLRIVAPGLDARHARPVGAEQSNSSVVYDDAYILKLFRRLASPNPDVEVPGALWRTGFAHVAEPVGAWRRDGDDLAVVQRFLPDGADGWELAVAAARAGRAFDDEAAELGGLLAALHHALARAFGTWPAQPGAWADAAHARVRSARHDRIDLDAVTAVIERLRSLEDAGVAIRVHGDLHLGQVMRSGGRWYVLDFEGEPTRPLAERRSPSSPLRDVAGMLRSFGYAVGAARRHGAREAQLDAWEQGARRAFLGAYTSAAADLLPRGTDALLSAFEVDKAVYEVAYELGNRPDWVDIPLDGLRAALARGRSAP